MRNKALTVAVAAVMAVSTLGVANAAEAQSRHDRGDRWEQRHDRGHNARHNQRNAQQQRQIQQRQRQIAEQQRRIQEQQRRLQQQQRAHQARVIAQRRYNAGVYQRPYGYQYRQWNAGYTLPPAYRDRRYAVDHRQYGLRAPPPGYQYTRVDNDVVLTAIATGLIASVIVGLFN